MSDKIQLNPHQRDKIQTYTLNQYPKEMCGFLTHDSFIPANNIHETPRKAFKFSKEDFARYFPIATAIVHSHCRDINTPEIFDLRTPSYKDFCEQKRTGIPWIIVGTEGQTVTEEIQFPRIRNKDYLGRRFMWFLNDCYTLVQDWYYFEKGIELPDYKIDADYASIRKLDDLFEPYIAEYGFYEIKLKNIQPGDLVLLDNAGFHRNHLGIFTGAEILHQDMLSVSVPFEAFYGRINKVLHYEG